MKSKKPRKRKMQERKKFTKDELKMLLKILGPSTIKKINVMEQFLTHV